jgi:formate hydrogenlyase subunit 3/multisubunit Na+/H+ antiporter MnhD subunit
MSTHAAALLPWLLLAVPLAAALSARVARTARGMLWAVVAGSAGTCVLAAAAVVLVRMQGPSQSAGGWFLLDALAAYHLAVMGVVLLMSSVFALDYFVEELERGRLGLPAIRLFSTLWSASAAAMALVLVSNSVGLMWVGLEATTLLTAFLICLHRDAGSLEATWKYILICSVGIALAFMGTILVAAAAPAGGLAGAGPLSWTRLRALGPSLDPAMVRLGFVFLLVGYGTKAGLAPMHTWLPDAHSQAPAPVSAFFSGFMINTGVYCLMRYLAICAVVPGAGPWARGLLVVIGLVSLVTAAAFILFQRDLKRLLAYHSVENIGIIGLGFGLGVIAQAGGYPVAAVLGYAGGLLHVANHATFKGLLFLDTGCVVHATGTRNIEKLGGLLKRMPGTGFTFLVGAVAISGLPPLNGFVSEFLILLAAFGLVAGGHSGAVVAGIACIAGLAMIGTLATACFAKAFGIVFLGEPRSEAVRHGHEPGLAMRLPSMILAAVCIGIGLGAPWVVGWMAIPVGAFTAGSGLPVADALGEALGPLAMVAWAGAMVLAVAAFLAVARRRLLARRIVAEAGTWDCGYAAPTARMQYTASSFAAPLVSYFNVVLGTRRKQGAVRGYFPRHGAFGTRVPDLFATRLLGPVFRGVSGLLGRLRGLQAGRAQLYVAYVAAMLIALLLWEGHR